MTAETVHKTPTDARKNGHAKNREPPEIPSAKGHGNEVKDKEHELGPGQVMDVA
jgi:hypothetical protein